MAVTLSRVIRLALRSTATGVNSPLKLVLSVRKHPINLYRFSYFVIKFPTMPPKKGVENGSQAISKSKKGKAAQMEENDAIEENSAEIGKPKSRKNKPAPGVISDESESTVAKGPQDTNNEKLEEEVKVSQDKKPKAKKGKVSKIIPNAEVTGTRELRPRKPQENKPVFDEVEEEKREVKKRKAPAKKKAAGGTDLAAGDKPKDVDDEEKPKAKRGKNKNDDDSNENKVAPKAEKKGRSKVDQKGGNTEKSTEDNVEEVTDEPPAKKPKTETLQNQTETDYSKIDFACKRKNSKGESPNFKIASWNVDGLRAWVKKDGIEYIHQEDADILCLQETKCGESKLPEEVKNLHGYKAYWCDSQKEGYAGVALLTKEEPLEVKYGLGLSEFDDEGRCITAEFEKFYLVNVYVPNAGRGLVTLSKRLSWNKAFKTFIADLDSKKPVIICGDMNVAHKEIDLTNPKTNQKNAGFTPEEREGMTDFLAKKYVDSFRELYPDRSSAYTFWSYMNKARSKNVGWRLDYFILSERLMESACDNIIRSEVFGSDHCPVTLFLHL